MPRLRWGQTGYRRYHTGNKHVALFVYNPTPKSIGSITTNYYNGVAWNGITAVTETPSGAEPTDLWANDGKYATLRSAEQFGGTIEAYTYPDAWEQCDGSITTNGGATVGQQRRKTFGLAYITTIGNDTLLNDYGEKLHLIYSATANPSERSYTTINDSPEAITFSWEFTTTPIDVGPGYKPTSLITIDSTKVDKDTYIAFKNIIYGSDDNDAYLPLPADVIAFFNGGYTPPNQIYFGTARDLNNVTQLFSVNSNNPERTIVVDADIGEYIIYALPFRLGDVEFYVSDFEGGFEKPALLTLTNKTGYQELYRVYRSTRANLGRTTVEVKGV